MVRQKFMVDFYEKAKKLHLESINQESNNFLRNEIKFPLSDMKLIEEFIQIKYFSKDIEKYIIQVRLTLISPQDKSVGRYDYFENEIGEPLDDFLVFD